MSRANRRERERRGGPADEESRTPEAGPRRPVRRREPVTPAPGSTEPAPWSMRGIATLLLMVVALDALTAPLYSLAGGSIAYNMVAVDYIRPFLFPLLCMPFARRLAGEPRSMRILETLALGAVLLLIVLAAGNLAISLSGHGLDSHDGKQLAGLGLAELVGVAVTAVVYPPLYRRFWMPRRPGTRR